MFENGAVHLQFSHTAVCISKMAVAKFLFCAASCFPALMGKEPSSVRRSKLKLTYSFSEKLLQILSFVALTVLVVLTICAMAGLSTKIPTHFGVGGSPDSWGGKGSLLLLPIMGGVLYLSLTILERFPWIYNYPVEITKENAARQYGLARRLLEWMKFILTGTFLYLQWQTIQVAKGLSGGFGVWFLPAFLLLLFGVTGILIYKMFKAG